METQQQYHVYLDYNGYIIDDKTFKTSPAPLLGSKFSTGRSAYSSLDFWQYGAMTDFSHGINQKFLSIDPSQYYLSNGIDPTVPGEFKLEKDPQVYTRPSGMIGTPSAHYVAISPAKYLYVGTDIGELFRHDGTNWVKVSFNTIAPVNMIIGTKYKIATLGTTNYTQFGASSNTVGTVFTCSKVGLATDDGTVSQYEKITSLYEIGGSKNRDILFVATGNGRIYSNNNSVFATSIVAGTVYRIIKRGTTDFTTIGASNNLPGTVFTATGTGTGNGQCCSMDSFNDVSIGTEFPRSSDDYDEENTFKVLGSRRFFQQFKVTMGGDSFNNLEIKMKANGTIGRLVVCIHEEDPTQSGIPWDGFADAAGSGASGDPAMPKVGKFYFDMTSASIPPGERSITEMGWKQACEKYGWVVNSETGNGSYVQNAKITIKGSQQYYLVFFIEDSSGDSDNNWEISLAKGYKNTYSYGGLGEQNVDLTTTWVTTNIKNYCMFFRLKGKTINNLFYSMIESDWGYGWFDDGVRQTVDGYNWTPEPPDPLWVLPPGEKEPNNAKPIPNKFIAGTKKGLWGFIGGASGNNIQNVEAYSSDNNFKGMDRYGPYMAYNIDKLGLYYTEGASANVTVLNTMYEAFKPNYISSIYTSGNDMYACVSENGSVWYLAHCNLTYIKQPKYWWLVKTLHTKISYMCGFDETKIYMFFDDNTVYKLDKTNGPYVANASITTSYIDEGMIKLLKLYNGAGFICSSFPTGISIKIEYSIDGSSFVEAGTFNNSGTSTYTIAGRLLNNDAFAYFANPTIGNKLQLRYTVTSTDTTKTPIITDIIWKYILQEPREVSKKPQTFSFLVICEDVLENLDRDIFEPGRDAPRTRREILEQIWETTNKKELLNYVGPDNKHELGLFVKYTGSKSHMYMTIDRTNYLITMNDGTSDIHTYAYYNKTITDVVAAINTWTDFTALLHQDIESTRTAHDLEPIKLLDIKWLNTTDGSDYGQDIFVGDKVSAVIIVQGSPNQTTLSIDGRGEDRVSVMLREVGI